MTFLQLTYFVETCRNGSTQKAAEKLNVSQPTVSVAVKSLEKELNCPLFDRTAYGLKLNTAGMEFWEKSEEILQKIDSLMDGMRKYSEQEKIVRIGIPPIISTINWPGLFCSLMELFPKISFENVIKTRNTLLEMLKKQEIDLAILPFRDVNEETKGVKYVRLRSGYPTAVVMSIENPLAANMSLTYEQVIHEPLIGYKEGESKSSSLKETYSKYGVKLQYRQNCTQLSTLLSLIQKNVGIAFLNKALVGDTPDIVCIPISDAKNRGDIYLMWNPSQTARLKKICQAITNYFQSLSD